MALLAPRQGASAITETIFEQRFHHVGELRKIGANISVIGRTALVRGVERLDGAAVTCTDIRAAAALVVAALGSSERSDARRPRASRPRLRPHDGEAGSVRSEHRSLRR